MTRRSLFRRLCGGAPLMTGTAIATHEPPLMPINVVCPRCGYYVACSSDDPKPWPPMMILTWACPCGWMGQSPRCVPVP